jgi:hypothetical protein
VGKWLQGPLQSRRMHELGIEAVGRVSLIVASPNTYFRTRSESSDRMALRSRNVRIAIVAATATTFLVAPAVLPSVALPTPYHAFADDRAVFSFPNFWNAATNLPFFVIGCLGLWLLRPGALRAVAFGNVTERRAYVMFFTAITLTALGSTYYHLVPTDARMVWDLLPMTIAFTSLVSVMVAERISVQAGARLLLPLVGLGLGSVIYWWWSGLHGAGNLAPYVSVQAGSITVILVIATLFPSRYTRGNEVYRVAVLYAAAKVAEILDAPLFGLGGFLSGHSIKHLLAAAAVWQVLYTLRRRVLKDIDRPDPDRILQCDPSVPSPGANASTAR